VEEEKRKIGTEEQRNRGTEKQRRIVMLMCAMFNCFIRWIPYVKYMLIKNTIRVDAANYARICRSYAQTLTSKRI
jgi:hypothetical protein